MFHRCKAATSTKGLKQQRQSMIYISKIFKYFFIFRKMQIHYKIKNKIKEPS